MIVTAYIDESALEGPRAYMAGYVARAPDWHGFAGHWHKLLKREQIPFSHIMDMRNRKKPFEDWDSARIAGFVEQASKIIRRYCSFGLTVAVDVDTHNRAYRANMPKGTSADSVYGMCSRAFFEAIPAMVERYMGLRHAPINFVLERHEQHFGDAERIFHELKKYEPTYDERLGTVTAGDKRIAGLQAADLLAYVARWREPRATFSEKPRDAAELIKRRRTLSECPTMHIAIGERHAADFHRASSEIARRTRIDRAARKRRDRNTLTDSARPIRKTGDL